MPLTYLVRAAGVGDYIGSGDGGHGYCFLFTVGFAVFFVAAVFSAVRDSMRGMITAMRPIWGGGAEIVREYAHNFFFTMSSADPNSCSALDQNAPNRS